MIKAFAHCHLCKSLLILCSAALHLQILESTVAALMLFLGFQVLHVWWMQIIFHSVYFSYGYLFLAHMEEENLARN